MSKKFTQILCLIVAISLSLTACNSGKSEEPDQVITEAPSAAEVITEEVIEVTGTPIPTDIPPTETPVPTIEPGDSEHIVMIGDRKRSFLLYVPSGLTYEQAVPVVFAFHGYTLTPKIMQEDTGLNKIADRSGFIVIYPAGVGASWNAGETGPGFAIASDIDDSGFIEEILSYLKSIVNIDPKRIYAVGFSLGGALVYRLACDMSDTFAAVASVSGPMMGYSACEPTRAVSVMHIHGLADLWVPFSGGGEFETPPVEEGIATWVALNSCTDSSREDEPNRITQTTYSSCRDGTVVELITMGGVFHIWPTQANKMIWMFLSRHPMP